MLELLKAVQSELQKNSNIFGIRNSNIYIVEVENLIPKGSEFPLITIKDYGSTNDQQLSQIFYQTSRVLITIFNRIYEIGDSTKNKGILQIEEDIFNILIDNKLDICEMYNAFPVIQEKTMSIKLTEKDTVAYKRLIMEYWSYRTWT